MVLEGGRTTARDLRYFSVEDMGTSQHRMARHDQSRAACVGWRLCVQPTVIAPYHTIRLARLGSWLNYSSRQVQRRRAKGTAWAGFYCTIHHHQSPAASCDSPWGCTSALGVAGGGDPDAVPARGPAFLLSWIFITKPNAGQWQADGRAAGGVVAWSRASSFCCCVARAWCLSRVCPLGC